MLFVEVFCFNLWNYVNDDSVHMINWLGLALLVFFLYNTFTIYNIIHNEDYNKENVVL